MMTRLGMMLVCCGSCLVLTGCGGGGGGATERTFDEFTIHIPEAYVEIPPALVENKQLLHKILKSFKVRAENVGEFEPNIIISRSAINPKLDFEQFWILNAQQLEQTLAGYTPGDKELISFTCNEQTIQGIYATFSVEDPRYQNAQKIWLAQYQFIQDSKGYIISAAYATQKEQKNLKDIIKTVSCNTSAPEDST